MKNSLRRHLRADFLTLLLQSQGENTEFEKTQSRISEIQSEQNKIVGVKILNKQFKTSRKITLKQKSKLEEIEKCQGLPTLKLINEKPTLQSRVIVEDEIFKQCSSLTKRVHNLKKEKLEHVIQKFQKEERKKMNIIFQKQKKAIILKYSQKKDQLKSSYQKIATKFATSFSELTKIKAISESLIEYMNEQRNELNKQLQLSLLKITRAKAKTLNEWKKSSNQEICKRANKQL